MDTKYIKWCPQHGYPLPCYKCGMPLTQAQQKEIYQAGIREVIKRIEDNAGETLFLLEDLVFWKELKEWVIEESK